MRMRVDDWRCLWTTRSPLRKSRTSNEEEVVSPPPPPPPAGHRQQAWTRPIARFGQTTTNFLALDKCAPKRQYLETQLRPRRSSISPPMLPYTALRRASPTTSTRVPPEGPARASIVATLRPRDAADLEVAQMQDFVMTAPGPGREGQRAQPPWYTNT
ncbi:hypothetical protein B0H15DRAFT_958413 [Mycena belliarum]|uniref:Lariat debranching enzyme C-terminal domain-containing protein n=1 Tax=Mycena belliarum TaxID=1033014 RepID=A0AAD6TP77_9AGAR|nr:hypothetical protein B0H15DRAFT_958413 [Mycena belliae]